MLQIYKWASLFSHSHISLLAYQGNKHTKVCVEKGGHASLYRKSYINNHQEKNPEGVQLKMGFYSCCVTTTFYIFAPFPGKGITNPTAYLRHNCPLVPWVSIIILIALDWSRACPVSGHRRTWKGEVSSFFHLITSCGSDCKERTSLDNANILALHKLIAQAEPCLFELAPKVSRDPRWTMLCQRQWQCPSNNLIEMPLGTAIANHFSPSSISWSLTSL